MSPEQASGDREIDARSDVYSLGCVIYELLAGEPPFTGPTAQSILLRKFTESPRPLRMVRDTVPPPSRRRWRRRWLARPPSIRFGRGARAGARTAAPAPGCCLRLVARPLVGLRPWQPPKHPGPARVLAAGTRSRSPCWAGSPSGWGSVRLAPGPHSGGHRERRSQTARRASLRKPGRLSQ